MNDEPDTSGEIDVLNSPVDVPAAPAADPAPKAEGNTPPAPPTDAKESRRDALSRLSSKLDGKTAAERARDAATGRFAPTQAGAGKPVAPPNPGAQAAPAPPTNPWDAPPKSWKKERHDKWAGVDPEVRQYIHEREDESRRGVEGVIPKAKLADQFTAALAPHEAMFRDAGLDGPTATARLAQFHSNLTNLPPPQKAALAAKMLRDYGVDMRLLIGADQQLPKQDDVAIRMQQQFGAMREQFRNEMKAEREAEEDRKADAEIKAFGSANPHFETLRPKIAGILKGGLAADLKSAYALAVTLDPAISALVKQDEARKAAAATHKAATQARAATVSVRSATPGLPPTPKATDRRAAIADAFDGRLNGRV